MPKGEQRLGEVERANVYRNHAQFVETSGILLNAQGGSGGGRCAAYRPARSSGLTWL